MVLYHFFNFAFTAVTAFIACLAAGAYRPRAGGGRGGGDSHSSAGAAGDGDHRA